MKESPKRRAPRKEYVSTNQLIIGGFETPFSQSLDPNNRWVKLANQRVYDKLQICKKG